MEPVLQPPRLPVGLQCTGDIAQAAADQAEVVPAQANLGGGSGGALAIGVCDRLLMLKYSTYSVISPEGCASILWKDAEKAPLAAEAMAITSDRLHELRLCDRIVPEPLGGAHRNPEKMAGLLKGILVEELTRILNIPIEDVLDQRYHRLMSIGRFDESG